MRNLGTLKLTSLALGGLAGLVVTITCTRGASVEAAQSSKPAAPPSGAPTQVGNLANQSADYDQPGDHYQAEDPKFWVRPGYKVTLVAGDLGNARFMAFDDKGILYLSRPDSQDVLTLKPNGVSYEVLNTYLDNYSMVQGLCWKNGWMYVSTSTSILKTRDNDGDGKADEKQTVLENLEGGSGHWWRSLLVTDDAIYTSVGDTSNISEQSGDREKIFRYDINGKNRVLWSSGIRNTEKLMLRPGTNEVWGGDQGSDWWGAAFGDRQGRQPFTDFNPPDEFNHYVQGGFYGHPYIMGNRVPRMEFATKQGVDIIALGEKTIVPAWCFGPHWAVDGFTFYTGNQFPADTKGDAFCGLHGSWNRKVPSGYRIERILFDKLSGAPYGSQIIVGTLTPNKRPLARPVDVVQAPDGSLLFSSDSNGSLYRVSYVAAK